MGWGWERKVVGDLHGPLEWGQSVLELILMILPSVDLRISALRVAPGNDLTYLPFPPFLEAYLFSLAGVPGFALAVPVIWVLSSSSFTQRFLSVWA